VTCTDCTTNPSGTSCNAGICACLGNGGTTPCDAESTCGADGNCYCDPSKCNGCCSNTGCVHYADQTIDACGDRAPCGFCDTAGNSCVQGSCRCGDGPGCDPGLQCEGNRCICNQFSGCLGCCVGDDVCVDASLQTTAQCGPAGSFCIGCPTGVLCDTVNYGGCGCQGRVVCGASAVAAGADHTCAVTGSGEVRCWGANGSGQAGINTGGQDARVPATVPDLGFVFELAAADAFTCVRDDTGIACWGDTVQGSFPTPVDLDLLDAWGLSLAAAQACTLTGAGPACWGDNTYGQLAPAFGDGGTSVFQPTLVTGLDEGTQQIAVGRSHTCALVDGGVKCWGRFDTTAATPFDAPLPTDVPGLSDVRCIASGDGITCAARDAGVTCFGRTATQTYRLDAVALGVGSGFACAVTSRGGDVLCWGDNTHGQLGAAVGPSSSTPVPVSGLDGGAIAISCGRAHACAVVANHQVACWGEGAHDKLGNASTVDEPTAVLISD
jgi:hypothetical protein